MRDFVHLHLHSEYSILTGACRLRDIPDAVRALGQSAVAVTDIGTMYGCADFCELCAKAGVRPIVGCEVTVVFPEVTGNVVLLAKDADGYGNLSRIVTSACTTDGRVGSETLFSEPGGLVCLSGGKRGPLNALILNGDRTSAAELAGRLSSAFGDDFYIELENQGLEGQGFVNDILVSFCREGGFSPVACNDVFYLEKADASVRETLACIGGGRMLSDGRSPDFLTDSFYLRSGDVMERLFGHIPEALDNTVRIAGKCRFEVLPGKTVLPEFPTPDGTDADGFLRKLSYDGYSKAVSDGRIDLSVHGDAEYRGRIEDELRVISEMGYSAYFLIVSDFVGYARGSGIPTGPGRGSGAGSLVAFLTGITEVDPVKYGLLFEAFLNRERVSMPDFDIDFGDRRRDEVIRYVTEKYGADRVAQITTFGTLAARAALRDAGRVLGLPQNKVSRAVAAVPEGKPHSGPELKKALIENGKIKELCERDPEIKNLFEVAASVEGYPRNVSTHAAGVVITPKPLTEYLPLARNGDITVTQYGMDAVARIGLLKFDFLALRYLTVIDDAVSLIRAREPSFRPDRIPENDAKTFALIGRGETAGVFQLENPGMRRLLTRMKPKSLTDIMVAIALHRPGPMDSIPRYLENRARGGDYGYRIDGLGEILDETCGCIVYQEQVMEIFRSIAGYSYGRADIVRRAIAKKKPGVIEAEREGFVTGATERGADRDAAEALFDEMADFADYAFKKSHSVAYGLISYETAYLKANYPAEYISALMNSVSGDFGKTAVYAGDLAKLGVTLLPPDINASGPYFEPSDGGRAVRFGLQPVRGIGDRAARRICGERENGPYTSFEGFVSRNALPELGERQLEALISSGCFDSLGRKRSVLIDSLGDVLREYGREASGGAHGQIGLFDTEPDAAFGGYRDIPEFDDAEKRRRETEACGVAFTESGGERKKDDGGAPEKRGKRLFVRVSDLSGDEYRRVAALCAIFEGGTPVWVYDSENGRYVRCGFADAGPRLLAELRLVAGNDGVVLT